MKRTSLIVAGFAGGLALLVSSCSLLGFGAREEVQASLAAGALLDYVAAQGMDQVKELDTAGETYDLQAGGAPGANIRAVTSDTVVWEFPDSTVTVTREVDDRDTATPTDDIITVVRETDFGFEANRVHMLVRPLRPTAGTEWNSYDDGEGTNGWLENPANEIDQSGTINNYLGEVPLSDGVVSAVWALDGDTVYAEQIVKEISNVLHPNIVHRTIIRQTADGNTTLLREREVDGTVVHTFLVDEYTDPDSGETYTRITRDDDSYALVFARGDRFGEARIVDYFDSDDLRLMRIEEVRALPLGTVKSTRTYFDAEGDVTGTRVITYSINYLEDDEDSVQVTRTMNGRTRVVTISESGDVYVVSMAGESYRMVVVNADTVQFLDDAGSDFMTAERNADGSWHITVSGGEVYDV